ncbi:MAG: AmmeMemoRadiSam system protein B [Anaerolineae bacterium]
MSELPIRQPAVAGSWYPGDPDVLRKSIQKYTGEAALPDSLGAARAVIAPHAGYVYSGPIAGYAFKALTTLPQKRWTVYLMGPAHRVPFRGVALGRYSAFRTPLGDAPIATAVVEDMVNRSPLYTHTPLAHVPEHCLEIEVPFLQMMLPDFQLVPMLFGDVDPRDVGADLVDHIDEDDLVVVSNDMSHFYSYEQAQQLDRSLLDAVMDDDEMGVMRGEACGRAPIVALMNIARHKGWKPTLLDYRTSGDTAGDKRQVVGYAAITYTE